MGREHLSNDEVLRSPHSLSTSPDSL
jgi:signal recognition particle subunit SRP14